MENHKRFHEAFKNVKHDTTVFSAKMRNNYPYNKNGAFNAGDINGLSDLTDFIRLLCTEKMVEVGSYYGASSVIFAKTGVKIDCIDPWSADISDITYDSVKDGRIDKKGIKMTDKAFKKIENLFDENTKKYPNLQKVKADSRDVVNLYKDESLDFVYIDANHTYEDVKKDIELWLPKIKKDGWIGGHDMTMLGVFKAVTEAFNCLPHTFKDSSWVICKDKDYKNDVNIYIGTGVTEDYLERAMKYLVSLNAYNNLPFIKKFCITLGFHAPDYLKESLPTVSFIYKSKDSQICPNKNNCMQHGEFLSNLDAKDDDVIIFTDGDIIIQNSLNAYQMIQVASVQNGEFNLSYNQGIDDNLLLEYNRLMNMSIGETPVEVVSNEVLEQLLGFNSMEYKCYNTGVMVATKETYIDLFNEYCKLFPVINKVFGHYAKQQYLLCYLIQKYYSVNVLNKSIHTHGHAGIPVWAKYNHEDGCYYINVQDMGINLSGDEYNTEYLSKIIFRHNLPEKKINICYLNAEQDGCGAAYYRISTPYKILAEKYAYKYNVIKCDVEKTDIKSMDIIVCQRMMNMDLYVKIRNTMREDAILVWDGDDDYFNVDDRNPHTESFKEEKTIGGITTFVRNSDLVTTSTEFLKTIYAEHRDKIIEVLPNGLDYNLWDKNYQYMLDNKKRDGFIRVGWQGGDSHTKDMRAAYKAMIRILDKYDNVILKVVGWDFTNFSEFASYKDRIEYTGWAMYHERYVQNIIDFDIGIAPLDQDIVFNKSKSNIKWLEYSALGIPTIASNEVPYQEIIDGETGLLIDNTEDNWFNSIESLVTNDGKRYFLGGNAKTWTRKRYDIRDIVDKHDKVFTELLKNR